MTGLTADGEGTFDPPPPGTTGLALCGRSLHHVSSAGSGSPAPLVLVVLNEQRAAMRALQARGARRHRGAPADRPASRLAPLAPLAPLAAVERSRLIALGIEVLTQAALTTEAECQRIIRAAETHAATIVKTARDEMERLTGWADVDGTRGRGAMPADSGAPVPGPPGTSSARAVISVRLAGPHVGSAVGPDQSHNGGSYAGPDPRQNPRQDVEPNLATASGPDPNQNRGSAAGHDASQDLGPGLEQDLGSGTGLGNQFFDSAPAANENPWGFMDDDDLVGVGPALLRRVLRRPAGARPQPLD